MRSYLLVLVAGAAGLCAQPLDPAKLLLQPTDAWPTFNGDYSGRRYSTLKQINAKNIRNLSLAWIYRSDFSPLPSPAGVQIKATPLLVNGVLYYTMPDHAWAVDARTGRQLWHSHWETKGGIHIGNRGVGIYGDWLFFVTPDCYLISLDKNTGKMRWNVQIADVRQQYFATPAPIVVGNRVIVGVGGDSLDVPGYLEARDPETGKVQWRWDSAPKPGQPGSETWPNAEAMAHGGGMTWLPGTYDPELNLLYWGTGNPNPVHAGQGRLGDNLWTCSIVALNADTGKLVWAFQVSPHDTHDWDAVETPVLFNADIDGRPRKLLAQGSRNGYFFVLDRTTGKNILTKPFVDVNWTKGINAKGQPVPNPDKDPKPDGTLTSPSGNGATNWPAPAYSPETGLFYMNTVDSFSVMYLTDTDPKPEGYGGRETTLFTKSILKAIDVKTGAIRWSHPYPGPGGGTYSLLATAGGLLFSGDPSRNFIAFDPATGKSIWHVRLGATVTSGPITYMMDGKQYLVVAAGDAVYAFSLSVN